MKKPHVLNRQTSIFAADIKKHAHELDDAVNSSRFLILGGAGSIGQAVTKEIFKRNPRAIHVVDINENNLTELVRDIRSSLGYKCKEFRTFALDCASVEYRAMLQSEHSYDFVLNLSALKHVRSEKDPFTLMRMIGVNILNTLTTIADAKRYGSQKYFCVSTDKAANPINMMGATKRIMELFLIRESSSIPISTARFANVAFSDGSLLHGFNQRLQKRQPISAPNDIWRYFITPEEAGQLCLLSTILGKTREIFIPKLTPAIGPFSFTQIATDFLINNGYEPFVCESEETARSRRSELIAKKKWPVFFFSSNTTGEKNVEEFSTKEERIDNTRLTSIGIVAASDYPDEHRLDQFLESIHDLRMRGNWEKKELVALFKRALPEFDHKETGRNLDNRM